MKDKKFLIWSFEHDAWWKPAWRGYTPDMDKAGEYGYETAVKICHDANRRIEEGKFPNEAMIPLP